MADEGLRLEAWTMPHVGTLTKKFDLTKLVESLTFNDRFNDLSDGVFTIPDDAALATGVFLKDRLLKVDEANHANDVGAMIRVLRGTTPILHQLVTRSEDSWSADESTTKITTEGLEWLLDRALVPAYDYPADPTEDSDWIYGADSVLNATGFEDTVQSVEAQHFSHTQTSGTYTITYSGQTTSALAFGATWFDVHQALEALSNIQDVIVTGAGTSAAPFVIEFLDPSGDVVTMTTTATGGIIYPVVTGGVPSLDGWTQSFHPQTGLIHGTYDNFEISTAQVRTGTYSLRVNNGATLYPTDYGGAQQVVSVTGGRTYRAELWVRPTFTGDFRLIIRTMDETAIDGAIHEQTVTANTWTKFTIPPFVVPKHIDQVIFRIGNLQSADTGDWYVDDAVFAPGFPAATLGLMMDDIRTAALAAGAPLAWLTPTWTTTLDSDGAAWDAERKWNVNHDQSIYQLIEYARQWNYESRIRWDVADNRFEWDMWNPLGGGQTRTGIAITGKSGVERSAPIVRRPPDATYMRVEGDLGSWGEFASTTLDDVWGRLEKAHRDRQGVNSAELDIFAERLITSKTALTSSRTVTVADPSILPWTAYEPGDMVTLNLAPKDTKQSLRIAALVVSKNRGESTPRYDVHFGAPVYSNEAALAQGLRALIRKFNRPSPSIPAGKTQPMLVGEGSTPTVVVAAANSTPGSKGGAQFHCLGTNDHLVIQQAMTWLVGQGGGRMVLCEGDFNLGGTVVITGSVWVMGVGRAATLVKLQNSVNQNGFNVGSGTEPHVTFSNFSLDGNGANNTTGVGIHGLFTGTGFLDIYDMRISNWDFAGVEANETAGHTFISDCWFYNNETGVAFRGAGANLITNTVVSDGGWGLYIAGGETNVVDCKILRNSNHGIYQTGAGASSWHVIVGNSIADNGGSGIEIPGLSAGFNLIGNNVIRNNTSHGVYVGGTGVGHDLVTGNVIFQNGDDGIRIIDSNGGNAEGNMIYANGQHGIHLTNADNWLVASNQVTSNSKDTNATYDGIFIDNDSDENFVTGNRVWDLAGGNGQRYGINVANANCTANAVVGNDGRGGGRTADYNDAGTGTVNVWAGAFGDNL